MGSQARALNPAPLPAPVRDPVTGPQRGVTGPQRGFQDRDRQPLPEDRSALPGERSALPGERSAFAGNRSAFPGDHSALVGRGDEAADEIPASRTAAPPPEFGQSEDEDDSGAAGSRRTRASSRLAARRLRKSDKPGGGARSGRSGAKASHRRLQLWLWAGVAVVVTAFVAVAATAFLTHSSSSSPSHTLVTPDKLGSYVRRPQLEKQMNARQLQQQVIAKSAGQASHVVSAVYENSAGVSGSAPPQIILFIGGNLAGVSPSGFITSFTDQFKGAQTTSAGSLGGKAACVNTQSSAAGSVALCTWADSDTFGVVASPTMSLDQLAVQMRAIRPGVERPAR